MSLVTRSAIVRQTPRRMFELVNDVEAYPQRFDWCEEAAVLEEGEGWRVARLELRLGALRTGFTTRNRLEPPRRIVMERVDGPFTRLTGNWSFEPLGEAACKVTLTLDFELAGLVGTALAFGFQGLADRMVEDFCREAQRLHG